MSISRPFKTRQLEALQDAEQAALYLDPAGWLSSTPFFGHFCLQLESCFFVANNIRA